MKLKEEQIKRQDFVDNEIHHLLKNKKWRLEKHK